MRVNKIGLQELYGNSFGNFDNRCNSGIILDKQGIVNCKSSTIIEVTLQKPRTSNNTLTMHKLCESHFLSLELTLTRVIKFMLEVL